MKKQIIELERKSIKELKQEMNTLRDEIAKMRLNVIANRPKDSNILAKKRKQLARIFTVTTIKKQTEAMVKVSNS